MLRKKSTTNEVVNLICEILDEIVPKKLSYKQLITFFNDRLGHDKDTQ